MKQPDSKRSGNQHGDIQCDSPRPTLLLIAERALQGLVACLCVMIIVVAAGGCDTGTPQTQIPGVLQAAPPLAEFDENNNYIPYYRTGEMNTPRYMHRAVAHSSGLVWAIGGSDERGLSSLDSAEFFDQSTFDDNAPPLESLTGLWIDTDIEGNPIIMENGPRILFSLTELGNSNLIIVGGSANIQNADAQARAEILDPSARVFTFVEGDMQRPRFRHSADLLGNGDLLIAGGQVKATITVIDETIAEGMPGRERTETRFPSTEEVEYYSPTNDDFITLRLLDNTLAESTLQTRRGRADHTVGRLAGADDVLGGANDMFMIVGGMQTLSAVSGLAPQTKLPGTGSFDALTSVEIFDPGTNIFTLIASVKLDSGRLDSPYCVNLGQFNDFTPDGVLGMGNAVLITHGNAGGGCPTTPLIDQIFLARYTPGAGPALGIRFFESRDDQFMTHVQHMEYPTPLSPIKGVQIGRCATNPVALPRAIEPLARGINQRQTWVFSLAGCDIYPVPGGCAYNHSSPPMLAGCVFDPFYNLGIAVQNGLPPRDLVNARRANPQNFLGIVGAWFTMDSYIDETLASWGTTPSAARWAESNGLARAYTVCTPLDGVDGRSGSFDDRILLVGGGRSYPTQGGEPTSPSVEIFLPPGSSNYNDN